MNKLFFFLISVGSLIFMACPNDVSNSPETSKSPESTSTQQSYVPKPIPVEDNRLSRLLLTDYWVISKYYHPISTKMALGKGRWFKFEKDGTFVSGRWAEQTARGVWQLYRQEEKDFILLNSSIDAEDAEFEIQKIRGSGDAMAWIGTPVYPEYDPAAFQIDNLMTMPTKAQYGEE